MLPFLQRLRQRKIVQWALAYAAAAWLSLEVFDLVAEQFFWPVWIRQGATVFFLFGLLITIVLAWYHGERGRQKIGMIELILLITLLSLGAQSVWHLRGQHQAGETSELSDPSPFRKEPLPANSVAVLPCLNLSKDEGQAYFADGLAAELITRLSAVKDLRIPSHTSSFSFKGTQLPIREIAVSLRVRHVLECDVSGDATRVKVAARLIDAESGYTLWSEAYNRTRAKLFDVQQDVAQAVVGSLEIELRGRERQLVNRRWTESVEAYDEFLQGIRHQLEFPTEEDVAKAKQHLERAIELDPGFGRAYARLAINWVIAGNFQFESAEIAYPEVKRLANKSIELDGDLYEAYWALGWAKFAGEYAWAAAEQDFRKTIELAPGEWKGYHSLGYVHGALGRLEQGFMAARMAIDADPLAFYPRHGLEVLFTRQRQYEKSLKVVREQAELFGWNPMMHVNYAWLLAHEGQEQEARQHLEKADSNGAQDAASQLGIGIVLAILGDREQALAIAQRWEERNRISNQSFWMGSLASLYALIGDQEQAMQHLLASRDRQEMWMVFLDDPSFDSLRRDSRFAALVSELELPEDRYLTLGQQASSD